MPSYTPEPRSSSTGPAVTAWWAALVIAVLLRLAGHIDCVLLGGSGQPGGDALGVFGNADLVLAGVLAVLGIAAITLLFYPVPTPARP